jgi:hypothetical protein
VTSAPQPPATYRRRARTSSSVAGLALLVVLAAPVAAQTAVETKTVENPEFRYSVALPAACRHEEGPGTLDAVCSPDLDAEKSAAASVASALVLEVGVEPVPDDAGKAAADLAQRYGEKEFKDELAEAICGESDRARVKIANAKQVLEDARVVYTADVACPEIKFLGLGERRASVRFVITPGVRYRLMARALKEDFDQRKEAVDAFFSSFRILPRG